jgi:predicted ribosomally synthesized peptide with SipW-like signal peptide
LEKTERGERRNNKEMDKKILVSMMVIGLVATLAGAGLYAYFSDTETSTNNVFQAGILNIEIADNNEGWYDGTPVSASWMSPSGWGPGDSFTTDYVRLRNVGTIDAKYIYLTFRDLVDANGAQPESEWSGKDDISNKIVLVSINERDSDGVWTLTTFDTATANIWLKYWGVAEKGYITLNDLVYVANSGGTSHKTGLYLYTAGGYPYLRVGGEAYIQMTFKLMEDTNNYYQGDTSTFNVDFTASNAPPDKIDESMP